MEKPFSISLIRCPSGFFSLPFCGLSKPFPFLRQFHLLVQPNLAPGSWPQFQKQKHFILIRFSHSLKGRMGLRFSFEGKGAYLFWTHPLVLGPSSSDHTHTGLTPQLPFPTKTNTWEHFPTSRMNPTLD